MSIKKSVVTWCIGISLFVGAIAPQKSHALIAGSAGPAAAPIASLGALAIAVTSLSYLTTLMTFGMCTECFTFGNASLVIGLLLLDDSNTTVVPKFKTIDSELAKQVGLTHKELESFNQELLEINAVTEAATLEINQLNPISLKAAQGVWASYKNVLSPESFSALQKIATISFNSIKK